MLCIYVWMCTHRRGWMRWRESLERKKGRDIMLAAALQHWATRLQSQVLTFRIQYIRFKDFMVCHACTHCLFLAVLLDDFSP